MEDYILCKQKHQPLADVLFKVVDLKRVERYPPQFPEKIYTRFTGENQTLKFESNKRKSIDWTVIQTFFILRFWFSNKMLISNVEILKV